MSLCPNKARTCSLSCSQWGGPDHRRRPAVRVQGGNLLNPNRLLSDSLSPATSGAAVMDCRISTVPAPIVSVADTF